MIGVIHWVVIIICVFFCILVLLAARSKYLISGVLKNVHVSHDLMTLVVVAAWQGNVVEEGPVGLL